MSKEKFEGGCKIHGPKEICGHTTFDCPNIDDLFKNEHGVAANEEYRETTEEDFQEWKQAVLKIYPEFEKARRGFLFNQDNKTQQKLADSLDSINRIIDLGDKICFLTYNFLSQNPFMESEDREFAEGLLSEIERYIFIANGAKKEICQLPY